MGQGASPPVQLFLKGYPMLFRLIVAAALLSSPAFAGDAAKGEADFKKCKS